MSHNSQAQRSGSGGRGTGRRRFLTQAAVGGATIVGASVLGGLDADAAFAAPMPSLDEAFTPSFVEGRIVEINRNVLDVTGSHGERNLVQLTNATSIWKLTTVGVDAIEEGDGLYARGVEMPDGTIAADAVWVNIVNIFCEIRGITKDRVHVAHNDHEVVGRVVPGHSTASYNGSALTSDLSRMRIGQSAMMLGAWRPSDNHVDIARISLGH